MLKELEIMNQNAIYTCISWYSKICWFPVKNAYARKTQEMCHVIHIVSGFSLGKV